MNTRCDKYRDNQILDDNFWDKHLPECNTCQGWFEQETTLPEPIENERDPVSGYFDGLPDTILKRVQNRRQAYRFQWAAAASILILAGFSWFWLTSEPMPVAPELSVDDVAWFYSSEPVFSRPGGLNGDLSDAYWDEVMTNLDEDFVLEPVTPEFSDSLFNSWFEETRKQTGGK